MSLRADEAHCLYCFDVLLAHFTQTCNVQPAFSLDAVCPLFVTWEKKNTRGVLDLRGCIGCLNPIAISSLREYALTSALRDSRFSPMQATHPATHCLFQAIRVGSHAMRSTAHVAERPSVLPVSPAADE